MPIGPACAAMKYRVIMDMHAARNANAHRSFHLSFDMIDDQMKKSPPLVGELRLIHMCSQSDGAAALIFASRDGRIHAPATRLGAGPRHRPS